MAKKSSGSCGGSSLAIAYLQKALAALGGK